MPACAKDYDPPDGEFLAHAADIINCLQKIFESGLIPASLQKEKGGTVPGLRPAAQTRGRRTTVELSAIRASRRKFQVRQKKPLLLVFSAKPIVSSHKVWTMDDSSIVSSPHQIRPDLILAV